MVLNETIMQLGSSAEVLLEVHRAIVVPELLILYIFSSLIILIVGLVLIDTAVSSYSKFLKIFFVSQILIIGFILIPLIFLPTTVHNILSKLGTSLSLG